jgi:hypothetical protein
MKKKLYILVYFWAAIWEVKAWESGERLPLVNIEDRDAVFEKLESLHGTGEGGVIMQIGLQHEFLERYCLYTPERRETFKIWSNNNPNWQKLKRALEENLTGNTLQFTKENFDCYLGLIKQFDKEIEGLLKEKGLFENDKGRVRLQKEIEEAERVKKESLKNIDTLGRKSFREIERKVEEIWEDDLEKLASYSKKLSKKSKLLSKKKESEQGGESKISSLNQKEAKPLDNINNLELEIEILKREISSLSFNLKEGKCKKGWGEYKKELQPTVQQIEIRRKEANKKYIEVESKYNEESEELDRALEKTMEESINKNTENPLVLSEEETQEERKEPIVESGKEIENQNDSEDVYKKSEEEQKTNDISEELANQLTRVLKIHNVPADEKVPENVATSSSYEEEIDLT